ncbi:YjhX family toxin [Shinella zoogloeoides]
MDISRAEQRILHLLAQGGRIDIEKDGDTRKIVTVACITRDGWRASGLDLELFRKLKRRRCIASSGGRPYRITQRGLELVRAQQDNQ